MKDEEFKLGNWEAKKEPAELSGNGVIVLIQLVERLFESRYDCS